MAGKKIGGIKAVKTIVNERVHFDVSSEVNFKVLWKKYNRKTRNIMTMEDSLVTESRSGIYMNDVLEDSSYFKKRGQQYKCYRFPDKHFAKSFFPINLPSMDLYYREPKGIKKIYSERFMEFCKVEQKGDGKYIIYLPNGKENVYTYEYGELVKVFVDRTWFNLTFKREL